METEMKSDEIPIIDLEGLLSAEGSIRDYNRGRLQWACKEWGFFLLVNHGLGAGMLEKLREEVGEFFKLSAEAKETFRVEAGDPQGYGQARPADGAIDYCHRMFLFTSPPSWRKPTLLPRFPPALRVTLEDYTRESKELGMKVLKVMGESIGMGEEEIPRLFEGGLEALRMNAYPPAAAAAHELEEGAMGITAHSDASAITILAELNGVSGLQVRTKDGRWVPVRFVPGSHVLNIGDNLEIISNGAYRSVEHRVTLNPHKERLSIAMFLNPRLDAQLGPSPSLIGGPANPPIFNTIPLKDYIHDYFSNSPTRPQGKSFLDKMRLPATTPRPHTLTSSGPSR